MLLCMYVATAWADVTIPYSAGKWESFWKSTDGLTLDERIVHTNCGSPLYYNSTEALRLNTHELLLIKEFDAL